VGAHPNERQRAHQKKRQHIERELRSWLRNHCDVISVDEALHLGATMELIRHKVATGQWARMHRGVYRDTAVPQTPGQDLRGAWLALRGAGIVSHTSAGWLWGLLPEPPPKPELSIQTSNGRRLKGVTFHHFADLDWAQAVTRQHVLVTNPLRTIVDMAGSPLLSSSQLTDAIDTALSKRLVTIPAITAELDRLARRGRPGVGKLRSHLANRGFIGAPEASVLESKMGRIIIATRLPLPRVELTVGENGEYRLDFAWPEIKLAVEVDGYIFHSSVEHKQRDDTRRNRLQQAGWTVLVYNWRETCNEPARLASEIITTYHNLCAA
jgi:very-short-patch-repair endonuclease